MRYQQVCVEAVVHNPPPNVVTSSDIEQRLAPVYERLRLPFGRLELMTGIDRKEVKVIKEKVKDVDVYDGEPDKIGKILSGWHSNPLFSDDAGPKDLPFEGESPCFSDLVQHYAKGTAAVTILKEFKQSKVVEETEEGLIRALKQAYIPNYYGHNADRAPNFANPEAIGLGSSMLVDHINTIFHNLYRHDTSEPEQLDLRATNCAVKVSKVTDFYQFIDKLGMQFLVTVDNWLSDNQVDESNPEPSIRLGVGVYSIEGLDRSVV